MVAIAVVEACTTVPVPETTLANVNPFELFSRMVALLVTGPVPNAPELTPSSAPPIWTVPSLMSVP